MTLTEKMADPQSAVVTETVPVTPKPGQFKLVEIVVSQRKTIHEMNIYIVKLTVHTHGSKAGFI